MSWVKDPDRGGVKVPKEVQERVRKRILKYAEEHYKGKFFRIDVRFRSQFCYIDAYREPKAEKIFLPEGHPETKQEYIQRVRDVPFHLGRLRYFGDEDSWAYAFYKYSDEKYELCVLDKGGFHGTPEEAFSTGAVYLQD